MRIVREGRGLLFLFLLLLAVLGDDLLLDVRGHGLVVAQGHGVAAPAAGDAAGGAAGTGARGNFDPSKLTPEQKAAFQARRKAAADAAAGGAAPSPTPAPAGGQ